MMACSMVAPLVFQGHWIPELFQDRFAAPTKWFRGASMRLPHGFASMPVNPNRRQDHNRGRLIAVQTQAIDLLVPRQRELYDVGLLHSFIL
jgi:hypothetical protein